MAVYKDVVVPVPLHSYSQKVNGVSYNYTYTEYYRNDEGATRNKSKATGILIDGQIGFMHPNDNYYSLFKIPKKRKNSEILNIGYTAVTESAFDELGLMEILVESFGDLRAQRIRSICAYMIKEGCVMSYIDQFTQDEYFLRVEEVLYSQRVSELFWEITPEEMEDFYQKWIPKKNTGHYICYDVTSVSTYSEMLIEAEYGYNRDHDKLPQLNLGLFTSEDNKYPLYLFKYNGSVNDVTNIISACQNARSAGLDGPIKLVMDGGFFDEKKLKTLHEEGLILVVGMPAYLKMAQGYIDKYSGNIFKPENYLHHNGTYGIIVENQTIFGIKGRVFIGLCTEATSMLNEDLDAKIERYEDEIKEIVKYSTVIKKKKYTGLFDFFPLPDSNGFTFQRNEQKINEVRKRFGYFVIFLTDPKATAQNIIDAYRDKDFDEKLFYQLKQYMDGRRQRTHSQEAFDGKYNVVMIALILRTWLIERLDHYKEANHLTLKRCMMKLSDVKMYVDEEEVRLLKSITAEQRDLMTLCSVDVETIEERYRQAIIEGHFERLQEAQ